MHPSRRATLLLLAVLSLCADASPPASVREQEIAQCLPGEVQTWGDGRDRPAAAAALHFVLDPQGAPAWFDVATVLLAVEAAAKAWSPCGVAAQATLAPSVSAPSGNAGVVRVVWSEAGSAGAAGLANLSQKTLSLNPAMFALLRKVNPQHDARETLQMVISHEMGHFFGVMAHSRRCVDVTSYYNDGKGQTCNIRGGGKLPLGVEYRATLPTACDIARCRAANGIGLGY